MEPGLQHIDKEFNVALVSPKEICDVLLDAKLNPCAFLGLPSSKHADFMPRNRHTVTLHDAQV
jgi:hypothetical protein